MVHIPVKLQENTSNVFLSYSAKTKCDGQTDRWTDGGIAISPGPSARREIKTIPSNIYMYVTGQIHTILNMLIQ